MLLLIRTKSLLAMALITVASSPPSLAPSHMRNLSRGKYRLDLAFDELAPRDARLEKLADGFAFTEARSGAVGPLVASFRFHRVRARARAEHRATLLRAPSL